MFGVPSYIPLALAVGTFLVVVLIGIGLSLHAREQARARELLQKLRSAGLGGEFLDPEREPAESARGAVGRALAFLGIVGRRVGPKEASFEHSRMRKRFLRAGLRRPSYPALFWGAKCLLALGLAGVFLLSGIWFVQSDRLNLAIGAAMLLAMAGFYLPDLWLNLRIARRKRRMFEGLPDALDLLVVCVEAGMGLDAAMNRIAEEMHFANPTLSEELRIFNLEVRAGKQRQDALGNLADRVELDDLSSLVILLIQTEKFGTSLSQALRIYSDTFRGKRYIMAEELAAKLPTKLMIPLILFIFPAFFVVILGPAAIRMYQMLNSATFF